MTMLAVARTTARPERQRMLIIPVLEDFLSWRVILVVLATWPGPARWPWLRSGLFNQRWYIQERSTRMSTYYTPARRHGATTAKMSRTAGRTTLSCSPREWGPQPPCITAKPQRWCPEPAKIVVQGR